MTGSKGILLAGAVACSLALVSCGGSRQDASEPSGTFPISIVRASFPSRQVLAQATQMQISVRNDGSRAVPDVAVTVNSFNCRSGQSGLADPTRPVWIVDSGPVGGETAYTNTWALGSLTPGATRTFVWNVTPVIATFNQSITITYRVAAGLNGKARAQDSQTGGIPQGRFRVTVAGQSPASRVDPNTGRVVRSPPAIDRSNRYSSRPSGSPSCVPAPGYGSQGPSTQQPGGGTGSQPSG